MSEVKLTLDEETTKWAQERADKQEVSLSQYIAGMVRGEMFVWRTYSEEMQRYFDIKSRSLEQPYPTRDQRNDRYFFR